MINSRFWKCSLLICSLGVCSVTAQQEAVFTIYGPVGEGGEMSCGAFSRMLPSDRTHLEWWLLGFVSGSGRELARKGIALSHSDPAGIEAWVTKYCTDHPLENFTQAAVEIVNELGKDRK